MMETKRVPVESLIIDPNNARKHDDKNMDAIRKSLALFGQVEPLVVQKSSGRVIGGNGRLASLRANGAAEVDIVEVDLDDEKATALALALNRTAELAEWDDEILTSTLRALEADGFDIGMIGFDGFDLSVPPAEGLTDPDAVPENVETRCQPGDLWQLGGHRLLCGDSQKAEDVARLMGGEKAIIFLTDPPYGVSYADKNAYLNTISPANRIQVGIENDHGTITETGAVWLAAYKAAIANCDDRASFYIFSPQGGDLMMMMMMIQEAGWTLKHMLVWVKNNHVLGRCDYHYKHEPIFYGWNKVHDFYGGSSCFSVLEFPKPLKNDLHPTMKPVELLEKLVSNSSKPDAPVLDLFLGSGSTLIACEKTGRRCFGMEISPEYCSVILKRWEDFTGKTACLLNGGENGVSA